MEIASACVNIVPSERDGAGEISEFCRLCRGRRRSLSEMERAMSRKTRLVAPVLALAMTIMASMGSGPAGAASPKGFESDAQAALQALYVSAPAAKTLGETAKGILIFPKIVKAGFIVGAQYG